MINNIKEELRAWLRPMSPLTALAKSLHNEVEGGQDDPSKSGKAVNVDDPFAGFDLDEMPDDQRKRLLKLKEDFEASTKKNKDLEVKHAKTEEFARKQQSEAARAKAVLQAHNIPIEGVRAPGQVNSADAKMAELVKRFEGDGLKPELAQTYAKMFISGNAVERESIMRELAPLGNAVSSLQAQAALTAAESQFKDVFAVPEVAAQIRENVNALVAQGNSVDAKTVEHVTSMAWGAHLLRNPDAGKKTTVTEIPQFKPGLGNGGHRSDVNAPTSGAPKATQAETVTIISELDRHMRQGLPSTKAKK